MCLCEFHWELQCNVTFPMLRITHVLPLYIICRLQGRIRKRRMCFLLLVPVSLIFCLSLPYLPIISRILTKFYAFLSCFLLSNQPKKHIHVIVVQPVTTGKTVVINLSTFIFVSLSFHFLCLTNH